MRNKVVNVLLKGKAPKHFGLQLFAEGGDGGDGGIGSDEGDDDEGSGDDDGDGKNKKLYSEADIEEIISRRLGEWEKKMQEETDEAKKLAKMNEKEKSDYKNKQLQKRIDELEDEKALSDMRDEARKILSDKGISVPDKLLSFMVSKDSTETKEAVDSFAELFHAAVNEAVKGKARQETPKESGRALGATVKGVDIGKMAKEARIIK